MVDHIISEPTMMGQHARNMFLNGDKQTGLAAWKVREWGATEDAAGHAAAGRSWRTSSWCMLATIWFGSETALGPCNQALAQGVMVNQHAAAQTLQHPLCTAPL